MKKLVMLVAVFVSLSVVSVFAADSNTFIDLNCVIQQHLLKFHKFKKKIFRRN